MSECTATTQSLPEAETLQNLLNEARALIFDCDGTLVRTPDLYGRGWQKAFRIAGLDMDLDWYHQRAGMSEHVLMDEFELAHDITLDRERTVRDLRATLLQNMNSVREIPQIASIARQYHGVKPMAVASGGPGEIVLASLEATGLLSLFDAVVTIEDVANAKPAPDLFEEAARRLKTAAGSCLVFEDSPQGMQAAHCAGMPAFDVNRFD